MSTPSQVRQLARAGSRPGRATATREPPEPYRTSCDPPIFRRRLTVSFRRGGHTGTARRCWRVGGRVTRRPPHPRRVATATASVNAAARTVGSTVRASTLASQQTTAPTGSGQLQLLASGVWSYVYRAVDQHGQVIDVYVCQRRDIASARMFVIAALDPAEVITDRAPALANVTEDLVPAAWHNTGQYENNQVECDHDRLKARLRPMRPLRTEPTASVLIRGHTFIQNLRRGHYELAVHASACPGWPPHSTNSGQPSDETGPRSRLQHGQQSNNTTDPPGHQLVQAGDVHAQHVGSASSGDPVGVGLVDVPAVAVGLECQLFYLSAGKSRVLTRSS